MLNLLWHRAFVNHWPFENNSKVAFQAVKNEVRLNLTFALPFTSECETMMKIEEWSDGSKLLNG
jgi:hypothetical protein